MRPNMKNFILLLVFFGLFATVNAAETVHSIKREGQTELMFKRANGDVVKATLIQRSVTNTYFYKDALIWGGDVGQTPNTILSSIKIQEGGNVIFLPLSAYSDLGVVHHGSLIPQKTGFRLELSGGDTGTGYSAIFVFDHGYLRNRTVRNNEFPDSRVDTTTYKFTEQTN